MRIFFNILIIIFISFATLEVGIRCIGKQDENGNFWVGKRVLKPYHIPLKSTEEKILAYQNNRQSFIKYDSLLGWNLRPLFCTQDSMYCHNSEGLRDLKEHPYTHTQDTLRIALFGDSYIYGSEIDFPSTMGYQLEKTLNKQGIPCEVINFGVGGFGIDQAYLKWKLEGQKYKPDLVIAGFQIENLLRNTNVFRGFYHLQDGVPFFKPRFILENQDSLKLINYPTPQLPEALQILKYFEKTDIKHYESFYHPEDFSPSFLYYSKGISYLRDVIKYNRFTIHRWEQEKYQLSSQESKLGKVIMNKFQQEVTQTGAAFLWLHIPRKEDIKAKMKDKEVSYEAWLQDLASTKEFVSPLQNLSRKAQTEGLEPLFKPGFHYSAISAKVCADVVAQKILFLKKRKD